MYVSIGLFFQTCTKSTDNTDTLPLSLYQSGLDLSVLQLTRTDSTDSRKRKGGSDRARRSADKLIYWPAELVRLPDRFRYDRRGASYPPRVDGDLA